MDLNLWFNPGLLDKTKQKAAEARSADRPFVPKTIASSTVNPYSPYQNPTSPFSTSSYTSTSSLSNPPLSVSGAGGAFSRTNYGTIENQVQQAAATGSFSATTTTPTGGGYSSPLPGLSPEQPNRLISPTVVSDTLSFFPSEYDLSVLAQDAVWVGLGGSLDGASEAYVSTSFFLLNDVLGVETDYPTYYSIVAIGNPDHPSGWYDSPGQLISQRSYDDGGDFLLTTTIDSFNESADLSVALLLLAKPSPFYALWTPLIVDRDDIPEDLEVIDGPFSGFTLSADVIWDYIPFAFDDVRVTFSVEFFEENSNKPTLTLYYDFSASANTVLPSDAVGYSLFAYNGEIIFLHSAPGSLPTFQNSIFPSYRQPHRYSMFLDATNGEYGVHLDGKCIYYNKFSVNLSSITAARIVPKVSFYGQSSPGYPDVTIGVKDVEFILEPLHSRDDYEVESLQEQND